jgi:triacylglycerol lipase
MLEPACRLIKASNLAYAISRDGTRFDPSPEVQNAIAAVGLDEPSLRFFQPASDGGINAFYYGETVHNEAIVAFRGTLPPSVNPGSDFFRILSDWLNDGEVDLVKGQDLPGRVHKGFLESLDALWPGIEQLKLGEVAGTGRSVLVTGHSKGGALVYLAAYRLARLGIPVAAYTFAAPRTGDQAFATAFDHLLPGVLRFEYQDDMVPHVPPATGAWLSSLKGRQLVQHAFPSEAPRLRVGADIAGAAERFTSRMTELAETSLSFASAGRLQFMDWDDHIVGDSLSVSLKRNLHLAEMLAEFKFVDIAKDHSSAGGYMSVPCGDG